MGLITTYKANTKTISAVRNNGTSIAYINDTLYYAKDSKNLMEITLGSVTNTTQHTLVDYGNSIGGISFKSTDEILFTESYSNFLY
ncbi:hypothetical protein HYO65_gp014 [Tenacibaculum phage PTm1]|uniref:Uncharacterized protein n=2 Tax=Shirahamavirus PTm1 TaxID=2846435 RepID=A0A5S9HX41_9CAUD|nr:hypothetical protein HYO65_gp014 [Tenacibaculum phage PTm1]BBI90406.1 hypothetical protein [Tenacibaculum phage PTm1]BBI90715.1 hypothetical protein [Tenacibaculum phage PTm5]